MEVSRTSPGPGPHALTGIDTDDSQATGEDGAIDRAVEIGDRLDRYEVVRVLGQGGMGRVFEGHDPKLDRRVAIKVLFRRQGEQDPPPPSRPCSPAAWPTPRRIATCSSMTWCERSGG